MTKNQTFLAGQIEEHREVLNRFFTAVEAPFDQLVNACIASLKKGGKILFCGNGGSAADSQHLAAELVVRYRVNRPALASMALTTDTSILTACANDFSYDEIFSRQVEAFMTKDDVLIGISTSGNSPNVIKALEAAKKIGGVAAAFSGRDGGKMTRLADPILIIPSQVTARIQEMHMVMGHSLCDLIESEFASR